jgi:hypothetical protein
LLRSLKDLEKYTVSATDAEFGSVEDFLLDDERWVVRYLIVAAGGILGGRRVLISPISFRQAQWSTQRFHVALTSDKIKNSPSVDVDKPVSRQHERDYYRYYNYPSYWGYTSVWGMGYHPGLLAAGGWKEPPENAHSQSPLGDVHLRSAREVCGGYKLQGSDETIGYVADFIVDDETWEIRYLVADVGHWWFGKKVLVSPHWARRISWDERKVYLDLTRDTIKRSPPWDPSAPVNRQYEAHLYDYYGHPVYWTDGLPKPVGDAIRAG